MRNNSNFEVQRNLKPTSNLTKQIFGSTIYESIASEEKRNQF